MGRKSIFRAGDVDSGVLGLKQEIEIGREMPSAVTEKVAESRIRDVGVHRFGIEVVG